MHNYLFASLTQYYTSLTPREVIHAPERVQRQKEGEDGNGQDVEKHPAHHVPFAPHDEYNSLQAVNGPQHNEGCHRNSLVLAGNENDKVYDLWRETRQSSKRIIEYH